MTTLVRDDVTHGAREGGPDPAPTPVDAAAQLVTFDVFDTVLTRAVGGPRSVAYVLAARLAEAGVAVVPPETFAAARARAEELTYRRFGAASTLHQIAVQLLDLLSLDPALAADVERLEIAVERDLSRPVPAALAQVESVRASGAHVGFLSDTPLPHTVVEGLLRAQGALRDGDLLWVSNELAAGKDRGTAYFEVARRLPQVPARWRHLGDNQRADVRMARLSGVSPTWLRRGHLNRYEQVLEDAAPATQGFSSLLAGAARRARLVLEAEPGRMQTSRAAVATGVAAPLLVGYVLWCLRQAQLAGCRRLYFVARDGEVMLEIAQRLVEGLGLDLDLRYLEGSRRAWLLPSMARLDADRLATVIGREERVTVRNCLGWVDVEPESVPEILAAAGFVPGTWDDHLAPGAVSRLVDLAVGGALRELVEQRRDERTDVTQDYLRQVGLLDGEPYALVDIGWQGTVGRLLTAVLERCGGSAPALECYFGVTVPRHDAPGRDVRGYMYDDWRGTGISDHGGDVYVALEMYTAGAHGRVEGYRRVDGRVEPVQGSPVEAALEWIGDVRRAIDVFCAELAPTLGALDPYADVRGPTWTALLAFWHRPTPDEVRAWGGYPFEDDVSRYPIAGHLPLLEVVRSTLRGRPRLRRRGTWPAGVWANRSRPVQGLHSGALAVRGAVRKAARARTFLAGRSAMRRSARR